jgi:ribosome-associated heat shock protein Hsp15
VAQSSPDPVARQRLDKWIWFARVVKTRSLAAALIGAGHVRVNGAKVDSPGRAIKVGDVLTIGLDRQVRVLKVLDCGERRGPYEEARQLYDELTQP